ncbi:sugar transferase [Sphingomonas oleivorans]|uniref:sugar transferase n=1 Tax=Sphingomonas oleivorans TaxID=1735121 RepID=UPI002435CDFD|nr:sugar transferase [Sphingomonas oleivorans]
MATVGPTTTFGSSLSDAAQRGADLHEPGIQGRTVSPAGLAPFGLRRSAGHIACKRLLDIGIALTLLLLLMPLMLFVALLIKLDSPGSIFFIQRRTGRGNRTFRILKFRTMTVREDGGTVVQATSGDARVTRAGAFLRRTSIDELPQLLNVLLGHMSLVGPRPHALAHDAYYACHIAEYGQRFSVRPGLTGLAQVSGLRGEVHTLQCMRERISADLDYIERWSLTLDIKVMFRTIALLGRDDQAY